MDTNDGTRKRLRGRGRGRGGRRGRRGRGRGKKIVNKESEEETSILPVEEQSIRVDVAPEVPKMIDLETDISLLEAPTFTTLNRGPPEPMLRLRWDHRVNLIGEKVLNPMIHCCDKCTKPILIYGRMIPCKHVFCLSCAKQEDKVCPRCVEKVTRVEQTGLGTVFMCTHGGTRYGNAGCRRTYLSQRDLQAHINHRHVVTNNHPLEQTYQIQVQPSKVSEPQIQRSKGDPRTRPTSGGPVVETLHRRPVSQQQSPPPPPPPPFTPHRPPMMMPPGYPPTSQSSQPPPPMGGSSLRTNLITVPIQDSAPGGGMGDHPSPAYHPHYQQGHPPPQYNSPYAVPPPQQPPYYQAPPGYQGGQVPPGYSGQNPAIPGRARPVYPDPGQQYGAPPPPQQQWQHQQPPNPQFYR